MNSQRFIAITVLFIVLNVSSAFADKSEVIIELCEKYGAPLSTEAKSRLAGDTFGSNRGSRTSDIVLINRSKSHFKLTDLHCSNGAFSESLFPVFDISAGTAVIYGAENSAFLTGIYECRVMYESNDGNSFAISTTNLYVGDSKTDVATKGNIRTSDLRNELSGWSFLYRYSLSVIEII